MDESGRNTSMQGVKRYEGDRSTASYLEPQDLVYLHKGWLTAPNKGRSKVGDVADAVETYIRQQGH
ncbi:MAG: hypothetical protein COX55_03730 [Zetaproteobacteria bacterium CG23_combo_of_CG06-09_8_20_14_all_54_7]|nr:MAG: hypothetical protein COX55_03730 [Zetaproteobacteria bacterium CG23_combo_of_CG06-09_8_20_14_all_54_7]